MIIELDTLYFIVKCNGYVPVYRKCKKWSGYVSENGHTQMTFILSSRAMWSVLS